MNFAKASLEELLKPGGHDCGCGKRHTTGVRIVNIGAGALLSLPQALFACGFRRPFVVCDANTYVAAGKRVTETLDGAGIPFALYTFSQTDGKIEPDEHAVGSLTMAFDASCDAIVAVGAGVINDCCKVLAHAAGRPMAVIATAPSMDGYASNSSSMIQNRMKVSLYNACAALIVADTDILCAAPMEMLHAGLGDMLAKYVSLCEWRVSHLVTGEYYCENVAGLVRASLEACVHAAHGLVRRDASAVEAVCRGLVLSGVAMSFAEISRPASGLEHYFSHLWEMMALDRGEPCALHGLQVGVGTLLTLDLLHRLSGETPNRALAQAAVQSFSRKVWEADMRRIFGKAAGAVIAMEQTVYHKNDPTKHDLRLSRIIAHWPDIQRIIREELPEPGAIDALMQSLGMPRTPASLGISDADTVNAYFGSREIRDKYLTSSLLWDMGLLEAFAPRLAPIPMEDSRK